MLASNRDPTGLAPVVKTIDSQTGRSSRTPPPVRAGAQGAEVCFGLATNRLHHQGKLDGVDDPFGKVSGKRSVASDPRV